MEGLLGSSRDSQINLARYRLSLQVFGISHLNLKKIGLTRLYKYNKRFECFFDESEFHKEIETKFVKEKIRENDESQSRLEKGK